MMIFFEKCYHNGVQTAFFNKKCGQSTDRIELLLCRAKVVLGLREERLGLLLVLALVLHSRLLLRRENLALLK